MQSGFMNEKTEVSLISKNIELEWSVKGIGFGQLRIYENANGEIVCSNEFMSKEFVKKLFNKLVDEATFLDTNICPGGGMGDTPG